MPPKPKRKPSRDEQELVITLFSVADRFNALAGDETDPGERKRFMSASRAVFGTAQALAAGAPGTLADIARASASFVRRHRVASHFAVSATEQEAALIAFCRNSQAGLNAQLNARPPVRDDEALRDWVELVAMHCPLYPWLPGYDRETIPAKLKGIKIVHVCQYTPTRLARQVLRCLGVAPASLKNFGAGAAKRATSSPNRSRKS